MRFLLRIALIPLRIYFLDPNFKSLWTPFATVVAFLVVGAAAKASMPESVALSLTIAGVAAVAVGLLTHRLESSTPSRLNRP